MEQTSPPPADAPPAVRVCGYVDRAFEEVTRDLDGPDGRATFARAFLEVTGESVDLETTKVEQVSQDVASYKVAWQVADRQGEATVTAIGVQRGREPMTEVLIQLDLTASPEGTDPKTVALNLRHFIDALSYSLASH